MSEKSFREKVRETRAIVEQEIRIGNGFYTEPGKAPQVLTNEAFCRRAGVKSHTFFTKGYEDVWSEHKPWLDTMRALGRKKAQPGTRKPAPIDPRKEMAVMAAHWKVAKAELAELRVASEALQNANKQLEAQVADLREKLAGAKVVALTPRKP